MRILLAAALIAAPAIAHAATYQFDTKMSDGNMVKSTAVLAPKALCMTSDIGSAGAKGKMVFVQDPPVIYYERGGKVEKMDQARIDQMKRQLQAVTGNANPNMQKMIEDALAKVPEAQREMVRKQMEKTMGGMMPKSNGAPKERKYVATTKTAMMNGYKTTEYTITEDGKKVGRAMVAPVSAVPQGEEMMARLNSMMDFIKGMMSQFGMDGMTQNFMNMPKGVFPISGEEYDDAGKVKQTFKLASASKDTPSDCKVPE
jgi:hypothetical protein